MAENTVRILAVAIIVMSIPTGARFTWAGQVETNVPTDSSLSPSVSDVTYCTVAGVELKLDIYYPQNIGNGLRPLAVYVHGGAWVGGDKRTGAGFEDLPGLISGGYVVASVNYRLAPEYKFPAQIEDVKCAIRFLRANAAAYHIDPSEIGAWGGSAGGHLVSLLGVTDRSAGFDVGQYLDQSSRVQAVVDYFGPTDLTSGWQPNQLLPVFGSEEWLIKGSPVTYVTKDDPPFLIVQGENDTEVPPAQSQEFFNKLSAVGVPATLIMVKNCEHSFSAVGGPIDPSRPQITATMVAFFDAHLRGQESGQTSLLEPIVIAIVTSALLVGMIIFLARVRHLKRKTQNPQSS